MISDTLLNILLFFYPVYPVIILFIYGYIEAGKLEFNKLDLYFEDLPDDFDGFRILHITDMHSVHFGRLEKKICALVRNESFDIAVFTGDYLTRGVSRRSRILRVMKRILYHISAPLGYFGIRGNHEKNNFIRQLNKNTQMKMIPEKASTITLGKSRIWISGVNRLKPLKNGVGKKSITKALAGIENPSKEFIILLSHTPDYIHLAAERHVDLMIAGDTHGGQVCLPYIGALKNKAKAGKKFIRGLNKVSQTYLYTSKGVGTTGLPIRILCRPEITMFTLHKRNIALQSKDN